MHLPFTALYRFFKKNPWAFWTAFLCSIIMFAFFAGKVQFKEDLASVIPQDEKTKQVSELFQNPKFADKVTIMVSLKDSAVSEPDSLIHYADTLVSLLHQHGNKFIKKIQGAMDDNITQTLFTTIQNHLPVFFDEIDYQKIDSLQTNENIKATLENNLKQLSSPSAFIIKDIIAKDPTGMSFIALKKLQKLRADDNFELYENYIFTKDFKTLLIFVSPIFTSSDTKQNTRFVEIINQSIEKTNQQFTQINALSYGGSIVSDGNSKQLKKDSFLTQVITIAFLILFIAFYFKKATAPLLTLIPVVYGALFSLAVLYFIKGSISVIAIATGSIVLGIAINYSLHVFNHHKHIKNIGQTIKDLAKPLTIGSLTTIFGFLCLNLAKSEMLRDLGNFAAFSLIGAAFCSLVFLPHFLKENKFENEDTHKYSWIDKIAALRLEKNKWLVFLIIAVTLFFAFQIHKISFESDMSGLSYMSAQTKIAEHKFNTISGAVAKSIYIVNEGATTQNALKNAEKTNQLLQQLQNNHQIISSNGVSGIYISDSVQQLRIKKWNEYWTAGRKKNYITEFAKQASMLGFSDVLGNNVQQLLYTPFSIIDASDYNQIKNNLLDDYIIEEKNKTSIFTIAKVNEQDKEKVIKKIESQTASTVLDRQYLTQRLTKLVNEDFQNISWIVSIVVALVLLITFGRIELMLIAFIPMLFSWVWILGIMALAGIQFNIVNIIVSTLIFGLGDDYSLFIMDGLLNEYKTKKKLLASYKSSIIISAITTIVGLGVLGFAQHPALQSIAFISVVGILSVVLMAQIMIPFLFKILISNRAEKGLHPWTLWRWHRSSFSFIYFASTSILLTLVGFVLVKLNLFGKKRGKYMYHILLSKFCMSVLYIMFNFRKKIVNSYKENFKKPAIVIANHQSFLDILVMAMLHPKLILLTNQWVWKSPVFGWAIKMADFYPVANGIENSVDLLKNQINAGYSIVVFPEGTRTSKGPMKRFHKGAFYLAEKLHLDIVPVVLHGTGYTMSKGDYFLKNGPVTATYLPRIDAGDASWGNTYQERNKNISQYFKGQYQTIKNTIEQPQYFAEKLKFNYLYKGPVLEWYLYVKIKLENYYQQYHHLLPKQGTVLDAGCGYGFMSYILYWSSQEQRKMIAFDYDEEKIDTANHCFDKTEDINFYQADITQFEFKQYDGIVMSDVLHYIHPKQQTEVIIKAINSLLPGGVLLIRDGDADIKNKIKGTKLTEFLSTKIFTFNKSNQPLYYISGATIHQIAQTLGVKIECINDAKYTSNVLWVIKKPAI